MKKVVGWCMIVVLFIFIVIGFPVLMGASIKHVLITVGAVFGVVVYVTVSQILISD